MNGIAYGQKVPEFTLKDQRGKDVSLYRDILSQGAALIVFYPGDFTMVCTKQLCNYQDNLGEFKNLGIQVVGISKNSVEDHTRFASEYQFQFHLLSDVNKEVAKQFGTTSLLSFGGISRSVFIVSKQGVLLYKHIESSNLLRRKSDELLSIIQELRSKNLL